MQDNEFHNPILNATMAFGSFAYVFFKSPIFLLPQRVKPRKTLLIRTKICNSKQCILL
jgi:hypothetical protein